MSTTIPNESPLSPTPRATLRLVAGEAAAQLTLPYEYEVAPGVPALVLEPQFVLLLVLPPVICAPSALLTYTGSTGACSTVTLRGSTPSSSARIMLSEV